MPSHHFQNKSPLVAEMNIKIIKYMFTTQYCLNIKYISFHLYFCCFKLLNGNKLRTEVHFSFSLRNKKLSVTCKSCEERNASQRFTLGLWHFISLWKWKKLYFYKITPQNTFHCCVHVIKSAASTQDWLPCYLAMCDTKKVRLSGQTDTWTDRPQKSDPYVLLYFAGNTIRKEASLANTLFSCPLFTLTLW